MEPRSALPWQVGHSVGHDFRSRQDSPLGNDSNLTLGHKFRKKGPRFMEADCRHYTGWRRATWGRQVGRPVQHTNAVESTSASTPGVPRARALRHRLTFARAPADNRVLCLSAVCGSQRSSTTLFRLIAIRTRTTTIALTGRCIMTDRRAARLSDRARQPDGTEDARPSAAIPAGRDLTPVQAPGLSDNGADGNASDGSKRSWHASRRQAYTR